MFKISNNLPEVFLKSPDKLARCVRQRGDGVLCDWGDLTHALASSSQEMVAFLVRAEPEESYTGQGMQDTQVKTASVGLEERCAAHQQKDWRG